jgi:hypothetical protein
LDKDLTGFSNREMTKLKLLIDEELKKFTDVEDEIKPVKMSKQNREKVKEMDVDDLVSYINQEEQKPKKSKKKNTKKGKNPKQEKPEPAPFSKDKLDMEIQEFKDVLQNSTVRAHKIRKIKPTLTNEWLTSLAKSVKSI